MDIFEFEKIIKEEENRSMNENQNLREEILANIGGMVKNDEEINYDETEREKKSNTEKVNIIIAGKTGVGKSSLINYIFGSKVAEVGTGKPITQEIGVYYLEKDNINLYDTKGIEAEDYENTLENIREFLTEKQNSKYEEEHIHIAWLCISERGDRIESADLKLLDILVECGIPTIAVFTKRDTVKESKFVNQVIEDKTLEKSKAIVRVRSIAEKVEIEDEIIELKPRGAEELLQETYKYVPEGKQNAIKKAQKIVIKDRIEAMAEEANRVTNKYSILAGGIGATPLPFADSIALAALQTKLIIDINTIYRVNTGTHTFTDIAAALLSLTGVAQVGKLTASFLKVIPVIGWAANGTVAAGITKGIGFGYSEYLKNNVDKKTGQVNLDFEDLKVNFLRYFNMFKDAVKK